MHGNATCGVCRDILLRNACNERGSSGNKSAKFSLSLTCARALSLSLSLSPSLPLVLDEGARITFFEQCKLCRRARKSVAAMRLIPYFQRVASAGLSALFLVRVAEQRAGLPSGSICVHCLQVFACGHSSMPHTCTSTLARPTPPPESVTPPRQPTCSAAEVTVRHSAQVEKTVTHPLLSDEYGLKFTVSRRADQASMSAQGAQAHVTSLTAAGLQQLRVRSCGRE